MRKKDLFIDIIFDPPQFSLDSPFNQNLARSTAKTKRTIGKKKQSSFFLLAKPSSSWN
jgi:hypothetical protein